MFCHENNQYQNYTHDQRVQVPEFKFNKLFNKHFHRSKLNFLFSVFCGLKSGVVKVDGYLKLVQYSRWLLIMLLYQVYEKVR